MTSRSEWPALLSPSYASPQVSAPSPTTATTLKFSCRRSRPAAMPSAAEIEVAAWPAPKTSYSLSRALEKAGEAVFLTQRLEALVATGEQLVRIALVADVPDELIARRVERGVQRDRQLDDAETGADVAAGARADVDQARANLVGERLQLVATQRADVGRRMDAVENRHAATRSESVILSEAKDLLSRVRPGY